MLRLYLITPPQGDPEDAIHAALEVLPRGAAGVQLRQPLPTRELLERARSIRAICTKFATPFLVNDRADVALAAGADGVHLPAAGMKPKDARALGLTVVGESVHTPEEAARSDADFVVFAPVFDTPGKIGKGTDELARAAKATRLPVFALGGVDPTNAGRCVEAGARGVACIRSVLAASDPAKAAIALWNAIALALLLVALPARADDSRYQDFPVGSRATALGGAFVALSDDPSGIYYNPAGICDTRRLNVSVSASLYGIEKQSRDKITIDKGTFSIAGLSELNVIPGEVGLIKGSGALDDRGATFAYGFDVTVPQFRSFGSDATDPFQVHTRVIDRTFSVGAGAAMRVTDRLNVGLALHYVLRLYETTEDALAVTGNPSEPTIGSYHADATFENANLVALIGAKYHYDDEWLFGGSIGLPGIYLHSGGRVAVQDVLSDPTAPPGSRSEANVYNTTSVNSRTSVPALVRIGAAHVKPHRWTISGQLTGHLGRSYDRFDVDPAILERLRLQDHIERDPVIDLNFGGEYLLNPEYSIALGLFTSRTGAPEFHLAPDGSLASGSSRQPRVNLYGGTMTLGMIGQHAISRVGVSVSYGSGQDAVPKDPTGIVDPTGYSIVDIKQLFFYFFLASTFRY